MVLNELRKWLHTPYKNALSNAYFHRRLLVVNGSDTFVDEQIRALLRSIDPLLATNVFDSTKLKGKNRQHLLGGEWDVAILDCRQVFKPSIVMAVAGTVKKSGCLILLCPDIKRWPNNVNLDFISFGYEQKHSRYLDYFIEQLTLQPWVCFHGENETAIPNNTQLLADAEHKEVAAPFKSLDQRKAYEALVSLHKKNALNGTITAPRGRGKSTLLGLFIVYLLEKGHNILLTSSNINNVANILNQLPTTRDSTRCNSAKPATRFELGSGTLQWVAPDDPRLFANDGINWHLLIVDEAASIPLPLLRSIISQHGSWLLSTTLQGYEGSGSGFMLKLLPLLREQSLSEIQQITLDSPLRWYHNDPMERFFTSTCLFEHPEHQSNIVHTTLTVDNAVFSVEQVSELPLYDLCRVMQLLAIAHYQTTPDDFMRIYDSPEAVLSTVRIDGHIVAACIINEEGGTKLASLASDIAQGKRRPRGHLGAQRLALLSANEAAVLLNYWRINRIAVLPTLQRLGLGRTMLKNIAAAAKNKDIDAITTSYAATPRLDAFWNTNGFIGIDKGNKPNKASGETSALALKSLNSAAQEIISSLQRLNVALSNNAHFSSLPSTLRVLYVKKVISFTSGFRPINDTLPYLSAIAEYQGDTKSVSPRFMSEPIATLLAKRNLCLNTLISQMSVTGIKELQTTIRNQIDIECLFTLLRELE